MLKQIDHREWLSGRRRGPLAALLRTSLWLASHPYDWAMRWRNRQFDTGRRAIHRAAVPVISVGNLTTGGTGKTPLVASIASHLQNTQHKVGLISRGYGSIDGAPNDEAMELAIRLPNVPHIQKRDRFAAAQQIVKHHAVTVIVMDDGMQHRRLHRDFEIIVIDATDPFGEGYVLPRGYLRENVTSLRRADAIVLTRCDAVSPASLQRTEAEITALHPSASVYRSTHQPSRWHCETCRTGELGELAGHKAAAVCGIGNPAAFAKTIAALDVDCVGMYSAADHARFDADQIWAIESWLASQPPHDMVLCTQKDWVKIRRQELGGKPLRAIIIDLHWIDDPSSLFGDLENCAGEAPQSSASQFSASQSSASQPKASPPAGPRTHSST